MNWKAAGMASTAVAVMMVTSMSASAGANKFTGNVSLGLSETFRDDKFFDEDQFTSIEGGANLNIAFESNFNLQLNLSGIGSFVNVDGSARNAGFQASAHGYWRDDRFAAGIFGGVGLVGGPGGDDAEFYFAGAEGQYYWNNFTFGVDVGYLDSNPSAKFGASDEFLSNAWFADAELRWYATPKVAVTANVGYLAGRTAVGSADQKTWNWGLKAEYWPEEKEPLSLWVAYEGRSTSEDNRFGPGSADGTSHAVKVGVTFHFGVDGSQQDQDRHGPAFNQRDFGDIIVGG